MDNKEITTTSTGEYTSTEKYTGTFHKRDMIMDHIKGFILRVAYAYNTHMTKTRKERQWANLVQCCHIELNKKDVRAVYGYITPNGGHTIHKVANGYLVDTQCVKKKKGYRQVFITNGKVFSEDIINVVKKYNDDVVYEGLKLRILDDIETYANKLTLYMVDGNMDHVQIFPLSKGETISSTTINEKCHMILVSNLIDFPFRLVKGYADIIDYLDTLGMLKTPADE